MHASDFVGIFRVSCTAFFGTLQPSISVQYGVVVLGRHIKERFKGSKHLGRSVLRRLCCRTGTWRRA